MSEHEKKVKKILNSISYKFLKYIYKEEYNDKIVTILEQSVINYEINKDYINSIRVLNDILKIDNVEKADYLFRIGKNYKKIENIDESIKKIFKICI